MNVRTWLLSVAAIALLLGGVLSAEELSARDIVNKSLALDQAPAMIAAWRMTVVDKHGGKKVYKFKVWEKVLPTGAKKLLRVLEPAENANAGLLVVAQPGGDERQWWFTPNRRKARPISPGDRDDAFLDSDLAYEDLGLPSPDQFEHQLISEVVYNGVSCYLIESTPKSGVKFIYPRVRTWIDKLTFVAQKKEMRDKNDKLLKTMIAKRVQQMNDRWTIVELEIVRPNIEDAKTTLTLLERQLDATIPETYFTPQHLETP